MPVRFSNLNIRKVPTPADRAKAILSKMLVQKMTVDGVFEGGGALGTAYVGALRVLHDNGIWFARVAGNSAGAITASMIAAGFSAPEIQWLSSGFPGTLARPQGLISAGIAEPIKFAKFLDLPTAASISQESKEKTILWKALKGTIIDEIGAKRIPYPTLGEAVAACSSEIMRVPILGDAIRLVPGTAAEKALKDSLKIALSPLPNTPLHVSDFIPNTKELRTQFANTIWDLLATKFPLMAMMTNFVHEGSLFEGTEFLNTIKKLFGRKIHGDPKKLVRFRDLKIPLAVIAANIDTGRMEVYNSKDYPAMEVAEAVRRSMSIPFAFQPRGGERQFVDGGLFSNFPLWLFTAGGQSYWPAASVDDNRLKIGFTLNEQRKADAAWNVNPARFQVTGDPPRINISEVAAPILQEKLVELGFSSAAVALEIANAIVGPSTGDGNQSGDLEILHQVLGVAFRGVMITEESTRKVITDALMSGRPYVDVSIPLLGYDTFDFYINEDEDALLAMWDRGWHAAVQALVDAKRNGILPLVMALPNTQTPFKI